VQKGRKGKNKLYEELYENRYEHVKGLHHSIESFRNKFEVTNDMSESRVISTSNRGYEDEREWRLNSESERRGKQELTFR